MSSLELRRSAWLISLLGSALCQAQAKAIVRGVELVFRQDDGEMRSVGIGGTRLRAADAGRNRR